MADLLAVYIELQLKTMNSKTKTAEISNQLLNYLCIYLGIIYYYIFSNFDIRMLLKLTL